MQSKLAELLHQYFELGVAEGREGRNHDTEAGDAQRVLSEIEAEIAAMSAAAPQPAPSVAVKALEWDERPILGGTAYFAETPALICYAIKKYGDEYLLAVNGNQYATYPKIRKAKAAAQADYNAAIRSALSAQVQDDPAQDERWNAGFDFALLQLCKVLKVDPQSINWDCATETLEGDAQSQIHKVLAAAPAKQGSGTNE